MTRRSGLIARHCCTSFPHRGPKEPTRHLPKANQGQHRARGLLDPLAEAVVNAIAETPCAARDAPRERSPRARRSTRASCLRQRRASRHPARHTPLRRSAAGCLRRHLSRFSTCETELNSLRNGGFLAHRSPQGAKMRQKSNSTLPGRPSDVADKLLGRFAGPPIRRLLSAQYPGNRLIYPRGCERLRLGVSGCRLSCGIVIVTIA